MPLTQLIAVAVRLMALNLIFEACKEVYLSAAISHLLSHSLSSWKIVAVIAGYFLIQVLIPLLFWYGAGWIARSLAGPYDFTLQLGSLTRNDLYQISFVFIGTLSIVDSLPRLMKQFFEWLAQKPPLDEGYLLYCLTELVLGLFLIVGNRVFLKLVPSSPQA
jgi:hypothetical protein